MSGKLEPRYHDGRMRRSIVSPFHALLGVLLACSSGAAGSGTGSPATSPDGGGLADADVDAGAAEDSGVDGSTPDAGSVAIDAGEAGGEAGASNGCEWGGAPGECLTTAACAAEADHSSYPNECPGPATIECCIVTPNTADNPATPAGYVLMQQSQVTSDMTTWAVAILNDPVTYPMFSTTTKVFGVLTVLARVEWHPPDFQNSVIHRGVTLYEPAD